MKTYVNLWKAFQAKVVEKITAHVSYSTTFSRKSCRLWDYVDKIQNTLLHLHNNDYAKAPQCYVIGTLPILLIKFNNFNNTFTTWIKITDKEFVNFRSQCDLNCFLETIYATVGTWNMELRILYRNADVKYNHLP